MRVLITGGAGYIGSTIASACDDAGITPVVLDNLTTGRPEFVRGHRFYQGDIADGALVDRVFHDIPDIVGTIHCAALVVVADSVRQPVRYHHENVVKTTALVDHLVRNNCFRFLFSSSAAVYAGDGGGVDERSRVHGDSPYGRGKAVVESALRDITAVSSMRCLALRYFNPIGADPLLRSGMRDAASSHVIDRLGESCRTGEPFRIHGVNWPTRDGTAVRDYIHVWDLALAHVAALRRFDSILARPFDVLNLGSGHGTTVRELVAAFERVIGARITVHESDARPGDTVGSYSRGTKSRILLGWRPSLGVEDGIRHHLAWHDRLRAMAAA